MILRTEVNKGDKTVLLLNGKEIGEYAGDTFIRSYAYPLSFRNQESIPMSEEVLNFNKSRGCSNMALYYGPYVIYSTVDEFMAWGEWVEYASGEWVVWCPVDAMRVYDNVRWSNGRV